MDELDVRQKMKIPSLTLLTATFALLASCSTTPEPVSSTHYKAGFAGFGWDLNGGRIGSKANAALGVTRTTSTPDKLYLKAYLPNPDGSRSSPIKKVDSGSNASLVMFEGTKKTGWIPNQRYTFELEVFSDPQYLNRVDSLSQPAVCIIPPLP